MSSILKALKKLENQGTGQNKVQFSHPKSHIQRRDHEQISGHLRFKKSYIILFAGLVLVVGAGLILNQIFHGRKPELITKKETIIRKPVRLPEKKVAITDRVQKGSSSQKKVKQFETNAKAAKAAPLSAYESRENTASLTSKITLPQREAKKEATTEKNIKKSEQNIKTDRFASVPIKQSNQTKIELQAIAWSNDPNSRLAVINGSILRERESIDNVIVMHIGKDAVIFKKGREEWKQMFGF